MLTCNTISSKNGLFINHQHLLGHIDMILGLSSATKDKEYLERIIVLFDCKKEMPIPKKVSSMSEKEKLNIRTLIVKKSMYAVEWQHIYPKREGKFVKYEDIQNDDDINELLQYSLNRWIKKDGGSSVFYNITSVVVFLIGIDMVVIDRIIVQKKPNDFEFYNRPIPINNRRVLSLKYASDDSWKVFSERICKNEFVKSYLESLQNDKCAICGKPLEMDFVIHHIDYDHQCALFNSGFEWRIPKTKAQPDCKLCYNIKRGWFDECTSRLRVVHKSCNKSINSIVNEKVTGKKGQTFTLGDRVIHRFYGIGIVTHIENIGKNQIITTLFENGRKLKFHSDMVPMIKI